MRRVAVNAILTPNSNLLQLPFTFSYSYIKRVHAFLVFAYFPSRFVEFFSLLLPTEGGFDPSLCSVQLYFFAAVHYLRVLSLDLASATGSLLQIIIPALPRYSILPPISSVAITGVPFANALVIMLLPGTGTV